MISREIRELNGGELDVASGGRDCAADFATAKLFQTAGAIEIRYGNLAAGLNDLAEANHYQAEGARGCGG